MTGFGTAAGLLGRPDVGLLGMAEMVDNARRIAAAIDIPLVADADTGYGNQINAIRTVQEFERAGAAGIHIEDQVMPKKCGHMGNKEVIDTPEFVQKIRAAVSARQDPDFVIIARTDARGPDGLDEAMARAHGCVDAGADVLFVEALQSADEIEAVANEFDDFPLLFNWVVATNAPSLSYADLCELGFAIAISPIDTLLAATRAMQKVLAELQPSASPSPPPETPMNFAEFVDIIGTPEIVSLEQRFA
jgi:2-methylisocitrate lyase-like PEP mutase family enzyme